MTALTTDTALSAEDKQKVDGIHVQRELTGDSPAERPFGASSKENISEGLGQVAVFRGPADSGHLVPHHQSHESEEVPKRSSPTGSKGGVTAIADFLATTPTCQVLYGRVQKTAEEDSGC